MREFFGEAARWVVAVPLAMFGLGFATVGIFFIGENPVRGALLAFLGFAMIVGADRLGRARKRKTRPCPRCGHDVVAGNMKCDECGFDFWSLGTVSEQHSEASKVSQTS